MPDKKTEDDKKKAATSQPKQQTQDDGSGARGTSFANIDSSESRGSSDAQIGDNN